MTRFLCTLFLALGSALIAAPPNLVVVLIDDMGWGDLSCFGNGQARTPNIDRLAAEGLRFEQFYVNSPICSPSRCAFTTGQYPQRWRISSYLNNRADNDRRGVAHWLNPQAPTVARMLQSSGYATGHFGKWHLGGQRDVDDAPPISAYGFDTSLTNFEGMGAKLLPLTLKPGDVAPGRIWADAERLGTPVTWMQRSEITTGYVHAALKFIDDSTAAKKPFFINVWPDDVHSPWWPPVDQWHDRPRDNYHAVLEAMDRQLQPLFDKLRSSPDLRENTLLLPWHKDHALRGRHPLAAHRLGARADGATAGGPHEWGVRVRRHGSRALPARAGRGGAPAGGRVRWREHLRSIAGQRSALAAAGDLLAATTGSQDRRAELA
jgi:arylsulfatase A-like enzyme